MTFSVSKLSHALVTLKMDGFCAGDEHFWDWRRTCFTLEMNTSGAGDERVENACFKLQTHSTYTHVHVQWRPQCCSQACLSGGVDSKLSFYFKISRALRASCQCLPFNLEKMAAVSVTVFEGALLRTSPAGQ